MPLDKSSRFGWQSNTIIVEFSLWEQISLYNKYFTDDTSLITFFFFLFSVLILVDHN